MNKSLLPIYLSLFLAPLAFSPSAFNTYEIPKSILINTSIFWTIGLIFVRILSKKATHVKYNKILIIVFFYFLIRLVSSFFGQNPNRSIFGHYFRQNGLLNYFSFFLLLFWLTQIKISKKDIRKMSFILLLGNLLPALYAIYQKISIYTGANPDLIYNQRPISTFSNPNFLAGYLTLTLPYALCIPRKKKIQKLFFYSFILINTLAILATESRSALLALALQVFLYLFFTYKLNKKALSFLFIFSILSIIGISYLRPSSIFDNRRVIWEKGIESSFQKPLLGWGPNNFDTAFQSVLKPGDYHEKNMVVDQAHNIFIENLNTGGILGLTAFFLLIFFVLKSSLNQLPEKETYPLSFSIFLSFMSYLAYSQLNVNSHLQEFFFFFNISLLSSIIPNKKLKIKPIFLIPTIPLILLLFILNLRLQFADQKFKQAFTAEERGDIETARTFYQQTFQLYPFEQLYNFKYRQFFPL